MADIVTKYKISFLSLLFCLSAVFLPANSIPDRILSIRFSGYPLSSKCFSKFEMFSTKVAFEGGLF